MMPLVAVRFKLISQFKGKSNLNNSVYSENIIEKGDIGDVVFSLHANSKSIHKWDVPDLDFSNFVEKHISSNISRGIQVLIQELSAIFHPEILELKVFESVKNDSTNLELIIGTESGIPLSAVLNISRAILKVTGVISSSGNLSFLESFEYAEQRKGWLRKANFDIVILEGYLDLDKIRFTRSNALRVLMKLSEDDLVRNILVPMFERMGFSKIHVTHGPCEYGVDILLEDRDMLGYLQWTGVQAKTVKIHANVSKNNAGNVHSIISQLKNAFQIQHEVGEENVSISRCFLITSHSVTPQAQKVLRGCFEQSIYRANITIIDGEEILRLINRVDWA
jgi:hypothetical protein